MFPRMSFTGLLLALAVLVPAQADDELPSREMLEFLADWAEADQETFELVVYQGLRDARERGDDEDDDDE